MEIKQQLIKLMKAHHKIGQISWASVSDNDLELISSSRALMWSAVIDLTQLSGFEVRSFADVQAAFNITDHEIYG